MVGIIIGLLLVKLSSWHWGDVKEAGVTTSSPNIKSVMKSLFLRTKSGYVMNQYWPSGNVMAGGGGESGLCS